MSVFLELANAISVMINLYQHDSNPIFSSGQHEQGIFVVFVEDNATMSLILYFENHERYFVQNRRTYSLLT